MGGDARAHVRSIEFIYIMNFRRSVLAVARLPAPLPYFRQTSCAVWIVESFSGAIKFNEIIFGVCVCVCKLRIWNCCMESNWFWRRTAIAFVFSNKNLLFRLFVYLCLAFLGGGGSQRWLSPFQLFDSFRLNECAQSNLNFCIGKLCHANWSETGCGNGALLDASDQLKLNQKLNNRISVAVVPTALRLPSSHSVALVLLCNDDNKHELIRHLANVWWELKMITTLNDEWFHGITFARREKLDRKKFQNAAKCRSTKDVEQQIPTQILLDNSSKCGNESSSFRIRIVAASLLWFDKRLRHTQTHAHQNGVSFVDNRNPIKPNSKVLA